MVIDRTVRGWLSPTTRAVLLLAALVFLPMYKNFYFLQVGALMLLILAAAAWAFTRRRDFTAGALIGLAAVLRVTPLIQAPMLLRSRDDLRRPAGIAGLVISVVALMAAMAILTTTTIEYVVTVVPAPWPQRQHPGQYLPARPAGAGRMRSPAGPGQPPSRWSASVQLALLGLTWVFSLGLEGGSQRAAVFAAFLAVTPIVSSITWDHHLVTELLVLALLAPSLRWGSRSWWLAVASYPLLWVPRGHDRRGGEGAGLTTLHGPTVAPFLLVTSLNLVGMVLLWLACLDVMRGYRAAVASPSTL